MQIYWAISCVVSPVQQPDKWVSVLVGTENSGLAAPAVTNFFFLESQDLAIAEDGQDERKKLEFMCHKNVHALSIEIHMTNYPPKRSQGPISASALF